MSENVAPGKLPKPTASELRILQHLWKEGPSTVREVHRSLGGYENVSYTTILKQLQIMHEKGLVSREASGKAHRYRAETSRDETQRSMLDDFVQRVYHGSASELVVQALGMSKPASKKELAEIEELLATIKKRGDSGGNT